VDESASLGSRRDVDGVVVRSHKHEGFEELVAVLYTGWMHVFIFTLCGITKGNEMPSS
jgi:hypothetical protein